METQQYTNYAFISYKREDEKWAKWLQKKLESYKLPSIVREQRSDLPKYLRPIFRDGTDLSGGILVDQLRRELLQSRYLIVICSPNATKSEWINREAQTFIDEGRIGQIVPFIVGGTPHASNPADECFPQSLRDIPSDKELLGINVQEVGKDMAFIRLVATMIGVRFDTLWQRHRRDLIRRRIAYGCAAALFCLLGLFAWDYNRATYEYFADWVDCYGVPEGILPLTDEQVSHRRRSYQFEYRRIPFGEPNAYSWRVAKVSYVNSAKRPQDIGHTELKDRYPIQEMEYNKQTGVVSRINFYDTKGKVLLRHVLTERDGVAAAVADFVDAQEQRGTGFIGADLSSMRLGQMDAGQQKSNIVRFVYERDEKGHIVKQTYHANNDYQLQRSAISDADGIFGRRFSLDSLGRRIKVDYLGLEGELACTKKGLAGRLYEYGAHGEISKTTYVNQEGKPTLNELMFAMCVLISDEWGNEIEEYYYGTDGQPCLSNEGIAKWARKYDDRGNMIEGACFGTDGQPCLSNEGIAKWVSKYDDRGNQVEIAYFGTDGQPCLNSYGCAKLVSKYDDRGNKIERAYFGTDGQPCLSKNGFAKWVSKYDDRGNVIEQAFFGTDGQPCLSNDGFAKCVMKYDDRGNLIESAYFVTDGQPYLSINGYAKEVAKYDDRGNEIECAFFGTDGQPCLISGYAKEVAKYDDRGNRIERAFFGTDGQPCLHKDGFAKCARKYDDRGNLIEEAYFGTDGQPCLSKNGYAKEVAKYDDRGNLIEQAYWGINDEPVEAMGYHRMERNYDDCHHRTVVTYYNKDNQRLVQQIGTEVVTVVSGVAKQAGLPLQSILLQWNDWKLGDPVDALSLEHDRSRYGKKNLYYMTPDGDIMHIYVERGLVGIGYQNYNIEKTQAEEWMKKLEAWKKEHGDK